jgi:hypothetical protein
MPSTIYVPVNNLVLDLRNFRNVPQPDEPAAIRAMISASPDYFWGLTDSLLESGYLPNENIIVLESHGKRVVKEGNRRVAIMKLILGIVEPGLILLPSTIRDKIDGLAEQWRGENTSLPCSIYPLADEKIVDRIVTLIHGKGERAGRDHWNSIARARHNRDMAGASEPALDLLEKFFVHGTAPKYQIDCWAGDYKLTILDEAIKRLAGRYGVASGAALAAKYPDIPHKSSLDQIVQAVGLHLISFDAIRKDPDFGKPYGVPSAAEPAPSPAKDEAGNQSKDDPTEAAGGNNDGRESDDGSNAGADKTGGSKPPSEKPSDEKADRAADDKGAGKADDKAGEKKEGAVAADKAKYPTATAVDDQTTVRRKLRSLKIVGLGRSKLVTVRKEMLKLTLKDNPIAFCFLLRTMFEISGKEYCKDHSSEAKAPTSKKTDGMDKSLAVMLREIVNHITKNNSDKDQLKVLHGAITQLEKPSGILSVMSMNQLVHNPEFTITDTEICSLFSNVFPLLAALNA